MTIKVEKAPINQDNGDPFWHWTLWSGTSWVAVSEMVYLSKAEAKKSAENFRASVERNQGKITVVDED